MCHNCGCGVPQDDMGNPENITDNTLTNLGQAWGGMALADVELLVFNYLQGQRPDDAKVHDLEHMFESASKAWGQTVDEAKAETLKTLKRELNL
jgi:hypothetical protein